MCPCSTRTSRPLLMSWTLQQWNQQQAFHTQDMHQRTPTLEAGYLAVMSAEPEITFRTSNVAQVMPESCAWKEKHNNCLKSITYSTCTLNSTPSRVSWSGHCHTGIFRALPSLTTSLFTLGMGRSLPGLGVAPSAKQPDRTRHLRPSGWGCGRSRTTKHSIPLPQACTGVHSRTLRAMLPVTYQAWHNRPGVGDDRHQLHLPPPTRYCDGVLR